MPHQSSLKFKLSLLVLGVSTTLHGQLIHRYSFNEPAGDASGATLTDSVGGADGSVLGAGAVFTGTGLDLPGGSSDTQAYGDLPNGLLSSQTAVTIEGWVTVDAGGNGWGRIFDFGSSEFAEVPGPGGGGAGTDYFLLSAARGADYNAQRVEVRNEDPAGGGISTFDSGVTTTFGTTFHYALTWENDGDGTSTLNYWRDGVHLTIDGDVGSELGDLNDVNNWLGRSNWTADANLDGTFDEFRIYEAALNEQQVIANLTAGPDIVIDHATDSDGDQMPDTFEDLYAFLDSDNPADAGLDEDNDGLSNLEEFQRSTIPNDDDSDADGLSDGEEVNTTNTSPLDADSDNDGLSDGDEINITGTNPLVVDTDEDGINDGPEVAAGTNPREAEVTTPTPIHRYTFNEAAGPADQGAIVLDSIGGADGVIVGADGLWTGDALTLPGGDGGSANAAYVDLPNGILSAHDHVTFEAWYTVNSVQAWSRIWDFGSTEGGEVTTTATGATQGQDYFLYAPSRGTDLNIQRTSVRNNDAAALGGGTGPVDGDEEAADTGVASDVGQQYHVAGIWTSNGNGGGQLTIYRDGVKQNSRTTTFAPRDINDVNNWLGRSNWTGDSYLNGDLNEFRIYDGAMNDATVQASFEAGPDAALGSAEIEITSIQYDPQNDQITLTFSSVPGRVYNVFWSTDLVDFSNELIDGVPATETSTTIGPLANPSPGATKLFLRVTN